jgi:hypothetical protein
MTGACKSVESSLLVKVRRHTGRKLDQGWASGTQETGQLQGSSTCAASTYKGVVVTHSTALDYACCRATPQHVGFTCMWALQMRFFRAYSFS